MRSSFFEFNIAMSGLFAAKQGLAVTSNNISNASTPGYSRQVLNQKASQALPGIGIGMIGTGVTTTGINRIRNSYLDTKMWGQNDKLGEYTIKTEQNRLVEDIFGEPSDVGFTKVFNDLFNAIDDLAKDPTGLERKEALRQALKGFTQYYNAAASALEGYQRDLNFELKAKVSEINMFATRIQSLNKQIFQAEMHGDVANELRDQRELMVDSLSKLINIEAKEVQITTPDGRVQNQFVIMANGQTLVDHFEVRLLDVKVRENKQNPEDIDDLYDVVWQDDLPFDMADKNLSGELAGIIDMRDGRGTSGDVTYRGIPYYIHRMDTFVQGFAQALNEVYGKGAAGYELFEVPGGDYSQITAKDFQISEDIEASASNIRVNYDQTSDVDNPNPSSNDMLIELLAKKDDKKMFKDGDPKDFMIAMFSEIGINTKEANMYQNSQKQIVDSIEIQRLAVSQVDTNEEFMNLVKYNQAYQAAAKIINTMDEIYETTIMRLGSW